MRFVSNGGGVVAIDGTGAEFRAVLDRLSLPVQSVVAYAVARVPDAAAVAFAVYADAAAEVEAAWDDVLAERATGAA